MPMQIKVFELTIVGVDTGFIVIVCVVGLLQISFTVMVKFVGEFIGPVFKVAVFTGGEVQV